MEFQTTEQFFKYNPWLKVWEVIRGILTLLYLPFAYGKHLVDRIRGIKEPKLREQNVWQEHAQYGAFKLHSFAIDNDESQKILESGILDFPYWKDWEDPFRFLIKFKREPALPKLNSLFFDEVDLKTKHGIYLIRINEKGKGMTLCLLSSSNTDLIEVLDLKSLSWSIKEIDDGRIQLLAYSNKGKHVIDINTVPNNQETN